MKTPRQLRRENELLKLMLDNSQLRTVTSEKDLEKVDEKLRHPYRRPVLTLGVIAALWIGAYLIGFYVGSVSAIMTP